MRPTRLLLPLLLAGALPLAAQSRVPDEPLLQRPFLDWDRGAYDDALDGYLEVLNGPRGAELKDQIAELTGELHPVTQIAPNGARLAASADGRWLTFLVVENGAQVTKVHALPGGALTATLPSNLTALLDSGRVAYVARRVTPEVEAARRAVAEAATAAARAAAQARLAPIEARSSEIRVRTLANGRETVLATQGWAPLALSPAGGALLAIALPAVDGPLDAIVLEGGTAARPLNSGGLAAIRAVPGGRWVIATGGGPQRNEILLLDRQGGPVRRFPGRRSPAISADGSTIAMLSTQAGQNVLEVVRPATPGDPQVLFRTALPLESPAVSPTGRTVAYQKQPLHDWEIYARSVSAGESGPETQLTFEIQHDALPMFLGEDQILAVKGEPRHRRSYVYSLTGELPLKLFHNNTVRTIAPEYEWLPMAGGTRVLIVADRDGDAISPERSVHLVDRTTTVALADVRQRLQANLGTESDLRARGSRTFLPIGNQIRDILADVSVARIESYAEDLFEFGSRSIFRPGNARTVDYLARRLREFGYEPEIQTFEAGGVRISNVIARLVGTTNPELVYVTSAHLDTVEEGPGSDDDGSGVTSLLEVARVLKDRPLAATVEFVFFTGEEEGLYGSLEYARRAVAEGKQVVGVVNNDMIGFTNDHRLDMTVRWSNPGIRDIMHGAAIYFTDLITYDAHYYRGTDAGSLNDAFGDIVGGMGAYPILSTPYYHQPTDRVENVNQRLVAEACKVTIASIILLASTPRPVQDLELRPTQNGRLDLSWVPSPEEGVIGYTARWTDALGAPHEERVAPTPAAGTSPARVRFGLETVRPGTFVSVKAVADDGREGWDWATIVAPR